MTIAAPGMRALVIRGGAGDGVRTAAIGVTSVHGIEVTCGFTTPAPPRFEPSGSSAHKVLVRVRGFSCNYRDRRRVLQMSTIGPAAHFLVIGSEFAGEVVAVGDAVRTLAPGMRVLGDNHYPADHPPAGRVGVPSNRASAEYLVLREDQLCRVPTGMSDAEASAFSIGAQTAYSMVRKMGARRGQAVLVTAARSNTSLFLIAALHAAGVRVVATTTAPGATAALAAHGASRVVTLPAAPHDAEGLDALREEAAAHGGFAAVADPFFDLHLCRLLPLLAPSGRYVTCGFHGQHDALAAPTSTVDYGVALQVAMLKNVAIIGNCAGVHADLTEALADWEAGRLPVLLDRVLRTAREDSDPARAAVAAEFVSRSFDAPARLGKVVALYTD
ncbi:MAG: zinc-binding alcohol dehydrogenase family protein [Gemmatimonadaceae bacterium]|nr:zinc-binding alcohol dehydrogenase family protein [Gemmatimonadaceae bacterium]